MEFVKVTFPESRGVQMDGAPEGNTGDVLSVQRGHHIFDLGEPVDYTPPSRTEVVAGTSQDHPMIIPFAPVHALELAPPEAVGSGRGRRTRRPKAGGARRASSAAKKKNPKKALKKGVTKRRKKR